MGCKFKNNAVATLAIGITESQTTIALSEGLGEKFPELLSQNDYFFATMTVSASISDPSYGVKEIVMVTGRNGDTLTVIRGIDPNMPARTFSAGDSISLNMCAQAMDALQEVDSSPVPNTHSGRVLYLSAGERLEFSEVGYIDTNFKIRKADADVFATLPGFFMCVESAGLNPDQKGNFLLEGTACNPAWNFTGGIVFLSLLTGGLTQVAPDADGQQVQPVGYAIEPTVLVFDPSLITIETKTEVA